MPKKKVVILTGAGMSAESGLKTFRDADGLWEGYDVMEVASPEGWDNDPELVLRFYNERRKQLVNAKPNIGHTSLVELEKSFDVTIITQNVDDLHERAGSENVIHLHGELLKVRSTGDPSLIYKRRTDVHFGDLCEKGYQLRPDIVWFGEMVPKMDVAANIASTAEILIIVGTSMVVYPAAGLIHYVSHDAPKYFIDPMSPGVGGIPNLIYINQNATIGLPTLVRKLLSE